MCNRNSTDTDKRKNAATIIDVIKAIHKCHILKKMIIAFAFVYILLLSSEYALNVANSDFLDSIFWGDCLTKSTKSAFFSLLIKDK